MGILKVGYNILFLISDHSDNFSSVSWSVHDLIILSVIMTICYVNMNNI